MNSFLFNSLRCLLFSLLLLLPIDNVQAGTLYDWNEPGNSAQHGMDGHIRQMLIHMVTVVLK